MRLPLFSFSTPMFSPLLIRTLLDQPHRFEVDGRPFSLRPLSLGAALYVETLRQGLALPPETETETDTALLVAYALELATLQPALTARFVAAHTLRIPSRLMGKALDERAALFASKLQAEELAQLLLLCLDQPTASQLLAELGIDAERERFKTALSVKDESPNSLSFGGKSIYGQLLAPAAERFGWTLHYLLWEISLPNLQLLLSDAPQSLYLSDKEAKRLGRKTARASATIIQADDPANAQAVREALGLA